MSDFKSNTTRRILIFLGLNFLLSSIFYLLIINTKLGGGGGVYVRALMWCPAIAALLTCRFTRKSVSELGWKWGKTRYQVLSYLIPIAYAFIAYLGAWISGYAGFYNQEF